MNTTLYPAAAAFAWTIVLGDLRRLRVLRREPARLATWAMYLFFALIFTSGSAVVWDRLDSWTKLPESNTLITMCLVVCYSASALTLLHLWSYPSEQAHRRVRITVVAGGLVLVTMIGLFVRSDQSHHHQQSFTAWYGGSVEYDAYLLIYLTTYTAAEIEIIRLCRRYATMITRSWLRSGLMTASVGAAVGLLYTFTRLSDVVAALVGVDISYTENIAEAGAGLGALVVMSGLTMHHWGPRVATVSRRARRLIAYARLRRLWMSFYTLDPSIAFDDHHGDGRRLGRGRAALRVLQDPEYHVARRVVEIRDGLLSHMPYQEPELAARIRDWCALKGLAGADLDAAVAATHLRVMLEARDTSTRRAQPHAFAADRIPADIDAELAWLLKVNKHFTKRACALCEPSFAHSETAGEIA